MIVFRHDGSPAGLLCALARAGACPEGEEVAVAGPAPRQGGLFETLAEVSADEAMAVDLAEQIRRRVSPEALRNLLHASASSDPGVERALSAYLRLGFRLGAAVEGYHAHPAVRAIRDAAARVRGEMHRLKGLVRFREIEPGRLWAPIEPDHDVVTALAWHFRARMPRERWILHDVRRRRGVEWNGREMCVIEGLHPPAGGSGDADTAGDDYPALWRAFFHTIAVPGRENPRLQRRNMPRRYWRWLVEMES